MDGAFGLTALREAACIIWAGQGGVGEKRDQLSLGSCCLREGEKGSGQRAALRFSPRLAASGCCVVAMGVGRFWHSSFGLCIKQTTGPEAKSEQAARN